MEDVKIAALKGILRKLLAFKDDIRFAVEVEGVHVMGNAKLVPFKAAKPKSKPHSGDYPRGAYGCFVRPYFKGVKEGDTLYIPLGPFLSSEVVSACSSLCNQFFGKGNGKTKFNKATGFVEVFVMNTDRTAKGVANDELYQDLLMGKPGHVHVDWRKETGYTDELPTPPAEAPAPLQQSELEDFIAQLDEKYGSA